MWVAKNEKKSNALKVKVKVEQPPQACVCILRSDALARSLYCAFTLYFGVAGVFVSEYRSAFHDFEFHHRIMWSKPEAG